MDYDTVIQYDYLSPTKIFIEYIINRNLGQKDRTFIKDLLHVRQQVEILLIAMKEVSKIYFTNEKNNNNIGSHNKIW